MLKSVLNKIIFFEGSTRAVGIIRLGIPLLLWARWAGELHLARYLCIRYPLLSLLATSFYLSTFLMFLGLRSRLATFWTAVNLGWIYYYVGGVLHQGNTFSHHVYILLAATFLLSLTPCGQSFSLDRWLEIKETKKRNLPVPAEKGPLWATRLIGFQLSMMYFWSALEKTGKPFLSGERLESIAMFFFFGSGIIRAFLFFMK